jgi:DNA-binding response OmpR family regulator
METRTLSVLVVDDEQSVALVFERLFKRLGYVVEAVDTGAAGLERVRHGEFDVYLIDKNLPDVSGLVVAKAARERSPSGVILLVTGYASIGSASELVGIADDYVSKPFELEHVRDTVAALLERRRAVSASTGTAPVAFAGGSKKVHVLVDSPNDEKSLVDALARLDARVTVGHDLPEAPPDLFVLSGPFASFEVRKRVWAWQARSAVRVVMLVDVSSVSDAMAAVALKVAFRITRPLDANALSVLARALEEG